MSVNDIQHGGSHYKKYGDLQPWDVVLKWNLGYLEGTALKYIARWQDKGGLEDIEKAIHFLQKLVEVERSKKNDVARVDQELALAELERVTKKWAQDANG